MSFDSFSYLLFFPHLLVFLLLAIRKTLITITPYTTQTQNIRNTSSISQLLSVLIYTSSITVSHPSSQSFALSESWVWVRTRFCAHDRPAHCHRLVLHCSDLLPVGFQECGENPMKCNLAGLWLVSSSLWQRESFSHQE